MHLIFKIIERNFITFTYYTIIFLFFWFLLFFFCGLAFCSLWLLRCVTLLYALFLIGLFKYFFWHFKSCTFNDFLRIIGGHATIGNCFREIAFFAFEIGCYSR